MAGTVDDTTMKATKPRGKKRKSEQDEATDNAKKTAPKKKGEKKEEEAATETTSDGKKAAPRTSKEAKKILEEADSKADALLSLMMVHYMRGATTATFEKLYTELGFRPKNKAMEQAWKEVKEEGFVEEAASSGKIKLYQLTQKGIDHSATEEYKQELANPPKTTDELHDRIKEKAVNKYGARIFKLLLGNGPMSGPELAKEIGVDKDGHGFFYAFKQLKDLGYAELDPGSRGRSKKFRLSDKCFIGGKPAKKVKAEVKTTKAGTDEKAEAFEKGETPVKGGAIEKGETKLEAEAIGKDTVKPEADTLDKDGSKQETENIDEEAVKSG